MIFSFCGSSISKYMAACICLLLITCHFQKCLCFCCSVAWSCRTLCDPINFSIPGFSILHYLPEFAQTHVHWADVPSSHLTHCLISFSSCPQSFTASGSFPVSQLFTSGGQRIRASASVLLMNIQDWFPLGLTGLIALLSKRLSRVFFSTTTWKHQFFGAQSSLWSNSHIHTWLLEKP